MKILIVQIGKIGDMVLTTPLLRAIGAHLPLAHVHVLASHRGASVLEQNPHVEKIILYRKDPLRLARLLTVLRFQRYDWWIDPKDHYSREGALLARLGGVRARIGFNAPGGSVFTHALPSQDQNYRDHAVKRNCAALQFLGIPPPSVLRPQLFALASSSEAIRADYGPWDRKTALLNVSAGDDCRLWDAGKWAETAAWCVLQNIRVLVSFQPSHESIAREVLRRCPDVRLFYSSSIKDMIALMPHLDWVVTPDTSIVHIASAFNIPQVALFPPVEWNVLKFGPLSDLSIVVQPKEGQRVASIEVAEVLKALVRIVLF